MEKVKKTLMVLTYGLFILLASVGVGLSGGVPIPIFSLKKEKYEAQIELVESKEEDDETEVMIYRQEP